MPAIAKRLNLFSESVIRDMTRIAIEHNAINLSQGFPDFDPPSELVDAARRAMDGGHHQYAITWGAPRFRQALARKQSQVVGILACGVQGRTNLIALASLFPVKRVYAYDILPDVQRRYIAEMSAQLDLDIVGVDAPRQAVIESDLVVTSGPILKHPTPTIEKDWLRPGAFASAVDYDSYWTGEALAQVDKLSTDDHAQFQYHRTVGYFQTTPDPYADLGEIVAGLKPGRERDDRPAAERDAGRRSGFRQSPVPGPDSVHA